MKRNSSAISSLLQQSVLALSPTFPYHPQPKCNSPRSAKLGQGESLISNPLLRYTGSTRTAQTLYSGILAMGSSAA